MTAKRLFIATLAPELSAYAHLGVSYVFEDFRRSSRPMPKHSTYIRRPHTPAISWRRRAPYAASSW
jgi:hypothetical protein